MRTGKITAVVLAATLGGCSFQAALDKLATPERQAELVALADKICTDPDTVVPQLHAEIQTALIEAKPLLSGECPDAGAKWQLVSYEWKVNVENGARLATEEAVLVAPAAKRWSTVSLGFTQQGEGPNLITLWNVAASDTKPPALLFVESWDSNVGMVRMGGAVATLLIVGLVVWLVRRRRRKKAAA